MRPAPAEQLDLLSSRSRYVVRSAADLSMPNVSTHDVGSDFDPSKDRVRLTAQLRAIWSLCKDGCWRSLREISEVVGAPEASVSANLRHLRKPAFGTHVVEKRRRSEGTWEYRVLVSLETPLNIETSR